MAHHGISMESPRTLLWHKIERQTTVETKQKHLVAGLVSPEFLSIDCSAYLESCFFPAKAWDQAKSEQRREGEETYRNEVPSSALVVSGVPSSCHQLKSTSFSPDLLSALQNSSLKCLSKTSHQHWGLQEGPPGWILQGVSLQYLSSFVAQ